MKPLQDILVLDLSQFLSGPSCSLRLADLGARVIKIEKPKTGDICRQHYVSNVIMNGTSSLFNAINRNKESFSLDLKLQTDKEKLRKLIKKADVFIHNFRPGVIDRLGFDYERVKAINPNIIYGEISGYGKEGPWKSKAGQDLLLQALSGLTQLSGNAKDGPIPLGLAVVDLLAGAHMAQGLLGCLIRRNKTKKGGLVEVSMLESILEFQFESITTYFHDGGQATERTSSNNAHAYLGAPYGIYQTQNGYLALAMGAIPDLGKILGCSALDQYTATESWYNQRDEIKALLADHLLGHTTEYWLQLLEPADFWCANVLNWKQLFDTEAFQVLEMIQKVSMSDGYTYDTTRCPITINEEYLRSALGAPILDEHNKRIVEEFEL
ncbi:MAG: CoA transferase [Bacteroidota bacterium]